MQQPAPACPVPGVQQLHQAGPVPGMKQLHQADPVPDMQQLHQAGPVSSQLASADPASGPADLAAAARSRSGSKNGVLRI
jgi:hypothetical protein